MLDFPEEFFQAEVRNDFLVDETMKAVWAAELEVLQEIAIICNRHNLTWYAGYGTLLGAVRHEGYIPWDDDIDIMMKRDDYMKLLEIMPEELPEGFCVNSCLNEEGFDFFQCQVKNSDSISIEPEHLRRFHGCPFSVGLDIFPLDHVTRNAEKLLDQRKRFLLIRQAVWLIKYGKDMPENRRQVETALKTLNQLYGTKFRRTADKDDDWALVSALWKLGNQIAMEYGDQDGDHLAMFVNLAANEASKFEKHWLDEVEYLQFEQILLPVPKEYDAVLRTDYGDYTVIRKQTQLHDYPIYIKQLEELRRIYRERMGETEDE